MQKGNVVVRLNTRCHPRRRLGRSTRRVIQSDRAQHPPRGQLPVWRTVSRPWGGARRAARTALEVCSSVHQTRQKLQWPLMRTMRLEAGRLNVLILHGENRTRAGPHVAHPSGDSRPRLAPFGPATCGRDLRPRLLPLGPATCGRDSRRWGPATCGRDWRDPRGLTLCSGTHSV